MVGVDGHVVSLAYKVLYNLYVQAVVKTSNRALYVVSIVIVSVLVDVWTYPNVIENIETRIHPVASWMFSHAGTQTSFTILFRNGYSNTFNVENDEVGN